MLHWLEDAVFYQLYPISFFDSNGDGKGDLQALFENYAAKLNCIQLHCPPYVL